MITAITLCAHLQASQGSGRTLLLEQVGIARHGVPDGLQVIATFRANQDKRYVDDPV